MKKLLFILISIFTFSSFFAADMIANTDVDGKNINSGENPFGNFAAAAIKSKTGASVAVIAAQSFNQNGTIAKGSFTENDLKSMFSSPNNSIVVLNLSEKEIYEMFERSVNIVPQGSSAFLQVAGATVSFNSSKPSNSRINSISISGNSISKTGTSAFSVAMPLDLGRGGNGYIRIFSPNAIENLQTTSYTLLSAVTGYIKDIPSIDFKIDDRIKDTK